MERTMARPRRKPGRSRAARRRWRRRLWLRRGLHLASLAMLLAGLGLLAAYGLGWSRDLRVERTTSTTRLAAAPLPTPVESSGPAPVNAATGAPPGSLAPAAGLRIDAIGLEAPVVTAPVHEVDGVAQWQVPDAAAGHGEGTANPGEAGNTVLMGHVQGVFRDLHRAQAGQEVVLTAADGRRFTYEIVDVRTVTPGEVSVVAPTPDATVTLITCAGQWLPRARDYTERLIVVARLRA